MRATAPVPPTAPTPPAAIDADPRPTLARLRDRRVEVSAPTRARTPHGERTVRIVGLSSRTALLVSAEPLGWAGQCVELDVPVLGGRDLSVLGGIARSERCPEGHATTLEFVVADVEVRRQLGDLLALLLAGDPEGHGPTPRLVYDVTVSYGSTARRGHLQEISLTGLSVRVHERMAHDFVIELLVPTLRGDASVALSGRVTGQRLSAEGGYITAVELDALDRAGRAALGVLISDLMCR